MGLRDWLRRRRDEPNDLPSQLAIAGFASAAATPPARFATVLIGDVVRLPRFAGFTDAIDSAALEELTAAVDGIESHELVGMISRPRGGFRWEPHPSFARVGVPPIEVDRADLLLISQPGPTSTGPPLYRLVMKPFQELAFLLVDDLDIP